MKNILICPLDWGMGHATRVRSIAWRLHKEGNNVIVAASKPLLRVFDNSVCSNKIVFSSLRIRYSRSLPQYLVILLQAPLVLIQFLADRYRTDRLVKKYNADIVISDNRFGCNNDKAYSIYITHQLNIKVPGETKLFARMLSAIHGWIASGYNECWIPDVENGLAGDLTYYSGKLNARYLGILSMLDTCDEIKPEGIPEGDYYAVIISGPEPQRTLLEEKLLLKLSKTAGSFVVAGGKARGREEGERERGREGERERRREGGKESGREDEDIRKKEKGKSQDEKGKNIPLDSLKGGTSCTNIRYYSCLSPGKMKYVLKHSKGVICRGGYSTLMDLVVLGKGAIVIPTPGQTEQEYLARELDRKGWVKMYKQKEIDNIDVIKIPEPASFDVIKERSKLLLDEALGELIRRSSSR